MGTIEHKTFPKGILLMQFAITLLIGILLPCNMKAQKYEGWRQNGNYNYSRSWSSGSRSGGNTGTRSNSFSSPSRGSSPSRSYSSPGRSYSGGSSFSSPSRSYGGSMGGGSSMRSGGGGNYSRGRR